MKSLSCDRCGTLLNDEENFCSNCGTPKNQIPENFKICSICKHQNSSTASFCEKCGANLNSKSAKQNAEIKNPNKIVSTGSYSGKMIKGKTSLCWKIFKNIIVGIILIGVVALIIWFQVDPDAGKKLTDVLMGIGFMAIFFFVGWLFMRGKKGKGKVNYDWDDDDQYTDISDDDGDD